MSNDRQVVKQLDHCIARVDDPQPLFKLLSETLQLPWKKLLAPVQAMEPGLWEIADGPAVRLVHGDKDIIQRMVFKVSDLKRAETFLREKDMLDSASSDQIRVHPAKMYGLDIRLV
ncbi:MAG TPA: hypothetical protein VGO69_04010 [Pyrinomonadaceae bacterium]|nr:hypothetical protein [Pyrinomonadaceae bacterium]